MTTSLWYAMVVVALTSGVGPSLTDSLAKVQAKPVLLTCSQTGTAPDTVPAVMTLRVDFSLRLVEEVAPSGKPYENRIAPNAIITENAIVWSVKLMDTGLAKPVPMIWAGTIDRLSGATWDEFSREPGWQKYRVNYTCRVASAIIK